MRRSAALLLFVLQWYSAQPVQVERVEVVGAALVRVETAQGGTSGSISASSERECLTITIEGHTPAGIPIRISRTWDAGCDHIYAPLVGRGDGD